MNIVKKNLVISKNNYSRVLLKVTNYTKENKRLKSDNEKLQVLVNYSKTIIKNINIRRAAITNQNEKRIVEKVLLNDDPNYRRAPTKELSLYNDYHNKTISSNRSKNLRVSKKKWQ